MTYIQVDVTFFRHPKLIDAAELLGVDEVQTIGLVTQLWGFAMEYAPDGNLTGRRPRQVARHIGWTGEPDALFDGLVEAGFLDRGPDGSLTIHDWDDYSGELGEKRHCDRLRKKQERRRAREEREYPDGLESSGKPSATDATNDHPRTSGGHPPDVRGNPDIAYSSLKQPSVAGPQRKKPDGKAAAAESTDADVSPRPDDGDGEAAVAAAAGPPESHSQGTGPPQPSGGVDDVVRLCGPVWDWNPTPLELDRLVELDREFPGILSAKYAESDLLGGLRNKGKAKPDKHPLTWIGGCLRRTAEQRGPRSRTPGLPRAADDPNDPIVQRHAGITEARDAERRALAAKERARREAGEPTRAELREREREQEQERRRQHYQETESKVREDETKRLRRAIENERENPSLRVTMANGQGRFRKPVADQVKEVARERAKRACAAGVETTVDDELGTLQQEVAAIKREPATDAA